MKALNLVGQKFGRLTILKRNFLDKHRDSHWLCQCDCGNQTTVRGMNLIRNHTVSCGCFQKEQTGKAQFKHGMINTAAYESWAHMLQRCSNKNNKDYKNYGGRGIRVCKKWFKFENFFADMGERPEGLTLERIRNNDDYKPSNCCWTTRTMQNNNSRKNVIIEYKNQRLTIAQWAKKIGLSYGVLFMRLKRNWSIEKALTKEV